MEQITQFVYTSNIKDQHLAFGEEWASYYDLDNSYARIYDGYNNIMVRKSNIIHKCKTNRKFEQTLRSCFGKYRIDDIAWTITFEDNRDYVNYELSE